MMGAARMVMGLATVAALAVIWKKKKESIWMWMLDKKKEMTATYYEAVTIWQNEMKMKDQKNKKKTKDHKEKKKMKDKKKTKRIGKKVKLSLSTLKEIKEMWIKKRNKKALQQMIALERELSSNLIPPGKKIIEPQQAHKEWRQMQAAMRQWQQMQSEMAQVFGRNCLSEFVSEIPSDLWSDILSRLPVKSVARFRCVCKQWRSLTYDAAFRQLHCERALDRKLHIIFVPEYTPTLGRMVGLPVYELGPADGQIVEYSPPIAFQYQLNYCISNPVNGLVVVYIRNESSDPYCYLLNPATREQSPLPLSKHQVGSSGCHVGFGFDASNGKYKLVRLLRRNDSHFCSCEILTVGTHDWRFIGETPCGVNLHQSAFLNGAIYWISWCYEPLSISVLAFDVKDEKFQKISSFIPLSQDVTAHQFSVYQFGGQVFLALTSWLSPERFLRIWTLKDDGESHEWKEEYNVNMSLHSNEIGRSHIHLLDIKDGKLMMQQSPSIYSYDLQSKALQEIYPLSGFYEVGHLYSMAESFISPKSLTDTSTS